MRQRADLRIEGMNPKHRILMILSVCTALTMSLALAGCAEDTTRSPASGPGIENPAAASGGDVIPAVGGAGNGGGTSGGGAGAGSGGQGAR